MAAWITRLFRFTLVLALIIFGIIFRKELRAWRIRAKAESGRHYGRHGRAAAADRPVSTSWTKSSGRSAPMPRIRARFMRRSNSSRPSAARVAERVARRRAAICRRQQLVAVERGDGGAEEASRPRRSDRARAGAMRALFAVGDVFRAGFSRPMPNRALPVGAPLTHAKDWWIDNRWMPNIFRDYFVRCAARATKRRSVRR